MNTAIVKAVPSTAAPLARSDLQSIADAFFSRRSPQTVEAYGRALLDFAAWMGAADGMAAVRELIQAGQGAANVKALAYMAELRHRGLSPSTINQRLAAIKSMIKLARQGGMIAWGLEVEAERVEGSRDMRGPGLDAVNAITRELKDRPGMKAARDYAILHLLWGLALRRAELCGLDLSDVDLEAGRITVKRKGQTQKRELALGPVQVKALWKWLEARGTVPGPLFPNVDRARKGAGRLTPRGLYAILQAYGRRHGRTIRPHGIRHSAITEYNRKCGGRLASLQAFSGHKSVNVLMRHYMDETAELQAEAAAIMGSLIQ